MNQVLTNLDSRIYEIGQVVVENDNKVESVVLIQSGRCNLNGWINSRGDRFKVCVVSLLESSWFGDFQILLDFESTFELEAAEAAK